LRDGLASGLLERRERVAVESSAHLGFEIDYVFDGVVRKR